MGIPSGPLRPSRRGRRHSRRLMQRRRVRPRDAWTGMCGERWVATRIGAGARGEHRQAARFVGEWDDRGAAHCNGGAYPLGALCLRIVGMHLQPETVQRVSG